MQQLSIATAPLSTPPADPAEMPVQPDRSVPPIPGQQPPSPVLPAMRAKLAMHMRAHRDFMLAASFRWRTV
ncbi:hypothetical protein [Pseudacidovorax intermedius]|uniref:Uncharacterized protein n=1 Tax=Pseudacidovorax intermedius TaxID=433924 RepID=A0A147GPJ9_9BURK|nr:hypothetical protein [Pseudacidovorax intermedius]KTT16201.1 hypothetical protein NS331_19040 [Pseudacidovorax intermedius]